VSRLFVPIFTNSQLFQLIPQIVTSHINVPHTLIRLPVQVIHRYPPLAACTSLEQHHTFSENRNWWCNYSVTNNEWGHEVFFSYSNILIFHPNPMLWHSLESSHYNCEHRSL